MSVDTQPAPVLAKEVEQTIVQEPMVGWFDPRQLIRTAVRALLGTLFGAYADKREVQAALQHGSLQDEAQELAHYAEYEELWIDYVADLGDGWDSTYSIAWLLSRESLQVAATPAPGATTPVELPRGHVLVMGGDQVYPTATRETYQNRFRGPYTAALPWVECDAPELYVIPGNHDWYDGLSSFMKLFCQQRWIGGRRTRQHRSYFVLQLPHRWWLWAVDIQLETDIDEPQMRYFEFFARRLAEGDRVILCTAVSSWIDAGDSRNVPDPDEQGRHPNLTVLEDLVRRQQAEVVLSLAGDLHHYSHYVHASGAKHKFTSGGGGAYLRGTHDLPDALKLDESGTSQSYAQVRAYPDAPTSRHLRMGNLRFFYLNPGYSALVGVVYLFYAWIWQSASKIPGAADSLLERWSRMPLSSVGSLFTDLCGTLVHHPGSTFFTLLLPFGLYFFADPPPRKWATFRKAVWGPGHGVAHIVLCMLLMWLFARVNLHVFGEPGQSVWQALLFTAEIFAGGFVLGGMLTGLYLALSNKFGGLHADESFSALHIRDYKNFLRLHLDAQGLTVYPIGVERVSRDWTLNPAAHRAKSSGRLRRIWKFFIDERQTGPWFAPASGSIVCHLIEAPIHLSGKKQ